jgi:AmiR/NasT family two-component response regulator
MCVGLRRVLSEDGAEVIGQEDAPNEIVEEAGRLRPDVVVLDLNGGARSLGERIREVSPQTKVILWARDETVMEVLDPESASSRLVAVAISDGLRSELRISRPHKQSTEE